MRAFGRVEHQIDRAVLDLVDDMRTPFGHLVDPRDLYSGLGEPVCRALRGDEPEAHPDQITRGVFYIWLVLVFHGDENRSFAGQDHARRKLGLEKSGAEIIVPAHDFTRGAHFRTEIGINARKARKRKHRFLDGHSARYGPGEVE